MRCSPGAHSSFAICTVLYSVVPLGAASVREHGGRAGAEGQHAPKLDSSVVLRFFQESRHPLRSNFITHVHGGLVYKVGGGSVDRVAGLVPHVGAASTRTASSTAATRGTTSGRILRRM